MHFSFNFKLEKKSQNFLLDIERLKNLTLKDKIIIFKTLTLSKIVFLAQILPISEEIID